MFALNMALTELKYLVSGLTVPVNPLICADPLEFSNIYATAHLYIS